MTYREQLNSEEVSFFHEHGYLRVRNVVPPNVLDELRAATGELQHRYQTFRDEPKVYYTSAQVKTFDEMLSGAATPGAVAERVLWRVDELAERMPAVAALKRLRFVHNAMKQLLGDDILQYNESFVTKPPRVGMPVHWHQDPSFKIKKTSDPIATCDIYLDEADEGNGCLWVVPGSHRSGVVSREQIAEWTAAHGFRIPGAVPVRMNPGDVAFHDNGCLHGSEANTSTRQRRIVYLAFQTLAQARVGGAFTEDFIRRRLEAFLSDRWQAFANMVHAAR